MTSFLPSRLLRHVEKDFCVIDPREHRVTQFDIISYTWGPTIPQYDCGIAGVHWRVVIRPEKIEEIKRFMITANLQYLWVDCICINQNNEAEQAEEIAQMYEYYKEAKRCHILIDMSELWYPHDIVEDLKLVDHVISAMSSTTLASKADLSDNVRRLLLRWATEKRWTFDILKTTAHSAGIELGVLNCYSTCINLVRSLFHNLYFSRVWTFQEMLLGKNLMMWGINNESLSCLGELNTWIDLVTHSKEKAYKLAEWIDNSRVLNTGAITAIRKVIEDDKRSLNELQNQVLGIDAARIDIITGGPRWWRENPPGVSNIFSAISITPRECGHRPDIFKGLLGVFSGLFTPEEIKNKLAGNDIDKISFAFFKQLSVKTGRAWAKLAITNRERSAWDWIPVSMNLPSHNKLTTTDYFTGVINLGRLKQGSRAFAKTEALTGIGKTPQKYMKITLQHDENRGFKFFYKGCNCGQNTKSDMFKSEQIHIYDQPIDVVGDQIGQSLVQCATVLGSIIDPGCNIIEYRKRLLSRLQPIWRTTDRNEAIFSEFTKFNAKPTAWVDRCVSGTRWENPVLRPHNMFMNFRMSDITGCRSRLENESTANTSCVVTVNCGCTFTAPFSWIFEAITSVEGSSLGDTTARLDHDNRIILQDGMGLVQVGDVGKTFNLIAFGGDVGFHKEHAAQCRNTKEDQPLRLNKLRPSSRALVPEEFTHDAMDMMRDYGYVPTGGSGNLLICRNQPFDQYKIIGVCIDEHIPTKKAQHTVDIR